MLFDPDILGKAPGSPALRQQIPRTTRIDAHTGDCDCPNIKDQLIAGVDERIIFPPDSEPVFTVLCICTSSASISSHEPASASSIGRDPDLFQAGAGAGCSPSCN